MLFPVLCQSPSQVEKELSEIIGINEKENALKSQLRFKRDVFRQQCAYA